MKDLDINIGHNRQPPGPRRRRRRARCCPFHPSACTLSTLPTSRDDGNHHVTESRRRLPEAEVARRRSAPLVHARSPFQSDSQRNIWPGRPDVSYWRNMARSREIFLLEALASGDVYLNNYFLTPSYSAYATPGYPPAAIFHPPRSSVVIPYVIFATTLSLSSLRDFSHQGDEASRRGDSRKN